MSGQRRWRRLRYRRPYPRSAPLAAPGASQAPDGSSARTGNCPGRRTRHRDPPWGSWNEGTDHHPARRPARGSSSSRPPGARPFPPASGTPLRSDREGRERRAGSTRTHRAGHAPDGRRRAPICANGKEASALQRHSAASSEAAGVRAALLPPWPHLPACAPAWREGEFQPSGRQRDHACRTPA